MLKKPLFFILFFTMMLFGLNANACCCAVAGKYVLKIQAREVQNYTPGKSVPGVYILGIAAGIHAAPAGSEGRVYRNGDKINIAIAPNKSPKDLKTGDIISACHGRALKVTNVKKESDGSLLISAESK